VAHARTIVAATDTSVRCPVCTVGGTDIADWLVRNGFALDWPQYSKGGYAAAQAEAKREQRGMWAGSFMEPWTYRACRRAGGRPESCSD